MKKIYLFILFTAFSTQLIFSQKVVKLEIEHLLGTDPFSFGVQKSTNLGHDFNVSRLEYYISEIRLEHDGGVITPIDTFWILVNADVDSIHDLGSHSITTLEAIHFSIGVDSAHNHLDPAQYPLNHPLAPKSPSMHWGWQSGYRFLAIEGKKGSSMDETYELHSLEDPFYYTQRIPTAGTEVDGELIITLKGDYTRILEDIDLNGLVIDHGDFPKNIGTLRNMHDYVFTSIEANGNTNTLPPLTTGIDALKGEINIDLYPNPVKDGLLMIQINSSSNQNYQLEIRNILGGLVDVHPLSGQERLHTIEINAPTGTYIAIIKQNGVVQSSNRVLVTN